MTRVKQSSTSDLSWIVYLLPVGLISFVLFMATRRRKPFWETQQTDNDAPLSIMGEDYSHFSSSPSDGSSDSSGGSDFGGFGGDSSSGAEQTVASSGPSQPGFGMALRAPTFTTRHGKDLQVSHLENFLDNQAINCNLPPSGDDRSKYRLLRS